MAKGVKAARTVDGGGEERMFQLENGIRKRVYSRASKDDDETTNSSCSTADPSTSGFQINGEITTTIDCFVCSGYQTLASRIRHLCDRAVSCYF
ncbi:hypothetical protein L1987_09253 [Smallanthus sonchifolius]|uniref:Uncharacterized protein n=1 Tax=Smallanthus sonchifolius TaxID=185202 RepID=A0ACB9JMW9_9ASTR|nr:hypothetical protein L1987_09253 [Smallanthus sonchifolius]